MWIRDKVLLSHGCRLEHNTKMQEKRKADKEFVLKQLEHKSQLLRKQREELVVTEAEVRKVFEFQNRVCSNSCKSINPSCHT